MAEINPGAFPSPDIASQVDESFLTVRKAAEQNGNFHNFLNPESLQELLPQIAAVLSVKSSVELSQPYEYPVSPVLRDSKYSEYRSWASIQAGNISLLREMVSSRKDQFPELDKAGYYLARGEEDPKEGLPSIVEFHIERSKVLIGEAEGDLFGWLLRDAQVLQRQDLATQSRLKS